MNKGLTYLTQTKSAIQAHVKMLIKQKREEFSTDTPWINDTYNRIESFSLRGKMIRGGLFLLSNDMLGGKQSNALLDIACGLEFFHSGLLIHDDIMDNDYVRRNGKSLFAQYEDNAKSENVKNARNYGDAMAICAGDVSLFLAYSCISGAEISEHVKTKLLTCFSLEAQKVGFGQMQDYYLSKAQKDPSKEDIFSVYTYKTARYTFTLPLILGAILQENDATSIKQLETLGENVGLVFQIRDDEFHYFNTETEIGKNIGSDIRENTKTIYRHYLFQRASTKEREKLQTIFGNPFAEQKDFDYVTTLMNDKNVFNDIKQQVDNYRANALEIIDSLTIDSMYKEILIDLLTYVYERDK